MASMSSSHQIFPSSMRDEVTKKDFVLWHAQLPSLLTITRSMRALFDVWYSYICGVRSLDLAGEKMTECKQLFLAKSVS